MPSAPAALAAARGTLLSIALRLASFLLSQLTVRLVSAAALGRASVPLDLLLSTALFVGREGFRLALTKEIEGGDGDHASGGAAGGRSTTEAEPEPPRSRGAADQRTINVSWLSLPAGALTSAAALWTHLHVCGGERGGGTGSEHGGSPSESHAALDFKIAGVLYCLAALVESLSEPLVIQCLRRMDVTTKAKAEGAALVLKSLSCFGCLHSARRGWFGRAITAKAGGSVAAGEEASMATFSVTAFGISQLVYALTFTAIMYRKVRSSKDGIKWPSRVLSVTRNPYCDKNADATWRDALLALPRNFDLRVLHMVIIFTVQGLFKHALTEADKIVLSALSGSYDQGVYALAASYGGLAARLLLQPVEENARLLFSRQGGLVSKQSCARDSARDGRGDLEKEKIGAETAPDLVRDIEDTYCLLLRVVLYVGLLFATIATNFTSVLLRALAGSRWGSNVEASAALSAFCIYTAFLALNGSTEAFVYGVAQSRNDVGKLSLVHAVVGLIFALIAPAMVGEYGAVGLVGANCISMGLRSTFSLHYALRYFAKAGKRNGSRDILFRIIPHSMALVLFGASFALTRYSRNNVFNKRVTAGGTWIVAGAMHIAVGLGCAISTMALVLWLERGDSLLKRIKWKRD